MSIHLSIFIHLSEVRSRRQQVQERNIPRPEGTCNPSSESYVFSVKNKTHFSCFYLWSCSCSHDPDPMTICEGWNKDRPVIQNPSFSTTDHTSVLITVDKAPIHLSITRSKLPSLVNKIPRYLNSSTWGRDSSRTQREHSTLFWLRTMTSDLEDLTFISGCFTLSCKPLQWLLKVVAWRSQQNHIIHKK